MMMTNGIVNKVGVRDIGCGGVVGMEGGSRY